MPPLWSGDAMSLVSRKGLLAITAVLDRSEQGDATCAGEVVDKDLEDETLSSIRGGSAAGLFLCSSILLPQAQRYRAAARSNDAFAFARSFTFHAQVACQTER